LGRVDASPPPNCVGPARFSGARDWELQDHDSDPEAGVLQQQLDEAVGRHENDQDLISCCL
jgi:hypothetical protein